MDEFEAAWNFVGIVISWICAGILLGILGVIATLLWNEW